MNLTRIQRVEWEIGGRGRLFLVKLFWIDNEKAVLERPRSKSERPVRCRFSRLRFLSPSGPVVLLFWPGDKAKSAQHKSTESPLAVQRLLGARQTIGR